MPGVNKVRSKGTPRINMEAVINTAGSAKRMNPDNICDKYSFFLEKGSPWIHDTEFILSRYIKSFVPIKKPYTQETKNENKNLFINTE